VKFILVNGRTPFRKTFCMHCCEPISGNYLRELRTQLPYCNYECFALHCDSVSLQSKRVKAAS
jgi:hypothetical protein